MVNRKTISIVPNMNVLTPTTPFKNYDSQNSISNIAQTKAKDMVQNSPPVYLPKEISSFSDISFMNPALAPLIAINSHHIGAVTSSYNTELYNFQNDFSMMDKIQGTRQTGVSRAWKYEYAEVKMGGKGTGAFNLSQRQELLESGRVRSAEGHHINNVHDYPELQANPDNIKMLANRDAHLREHHGDFRNETSGPLINRDGRLIHANQKRVLQNEISGIGVAVAIGLGTGFAIGFAVALAQNGLNPDSIKYAFISGSKAGGESAILAGGSTILGRTIGAVASQSLTDIVLSHTGTNLAGDILQNISKMCSMAAIGSLTIMALSVYQFVKLKHAGYTTIECLLRTGQSMLLSISTLILSIMAQGVFGGSAGIVVSVAAGIVVTGITITKSLCDKKTAQDITLYTISLCHPNYA